MNAPKAEEGISPAEAPAPLGLSALPPPSETLEPDAELRAELRHALVSLQRVEISFDDAKEALEEARAEFEDLKAAIGAIAVALEEERARDGAS